MTRGAFSGGVNQDAEVVVIGAGSGGLTAAAYLAAIPGCGRSWSRSEWTSAAASWIPMDSTS